MLHILWLIIKFILILLAIVLGLILLILLLVLFCPVRYKASIRKEPASLKNFKETDAEGKISWLFGLTALKCRFQQGQFWKEFYLFGIPVFKLLGKLRNRRKSSPKISAAPDTLEEELLPDIQEVSNTVPTESVTPLITSSEMHETSAEPPQSEEDVDSEIFYQEVQENGEKFFYKLGYKIRSFMDKIKKIHQCIRKIPSEIHKTSDVFRKTGNKLQWWKDFLDHPKVRTSITLLKTSGIRLLKHIFPTRLTGRITFGSTDPSVTGTVLAILGMTMPFHRNCIQVIPVFEDENILQGHLELKGRIYGIMLVRTAIQLYFNQNIKYVIRRWKHK